MADTPHVMVAGMLGAFSSAVCEAALQAGVNVCAVVVPGPAAARRLGPEPAMRAPLPVLTSPSERTIIQLAWAHSIPVFGTSDIGDAIALLGVQPDILAVACWPRLIPTSARELVRLAVNIHPSLLPENRGPAPLFWTFRLGHARTGVTVHVLEDRADAGPILAQREIPVPDGVQAAELELQLAALGGKLLAEVVTSFASGALKPRPQDESRATYYPAPGPEDAQT